MFCTAPPINLKNFQFNYRSLLIEKGCFPVVETTFAKWTVFIFLENEELDCKKWWTKAFTYQSLNRGSLNNKIFLKTQNLETYESSHVTHIDWEQCSSFCVWFITMEICNSALHNIDHKWLLSSRPGPPCTMRWHLLLWISE